MVNWPKALNMAYAANSVGDKYIAINVKMSKHQIFHTPIIPEVKFILISWKIF